jgi:hypothetical protein
MRRRVGASLYAGLLFTVLGIIAWGSGQPFIFPSLGPTAFVLAFDRQRDRTQSYRIIASHLIGGVAGLLTWAILVSGTSITVTPPAFSFEGFRLVASATLSTVLTSWAMIATDTIHPPACATTLIVSLYSLRRFGLVSSLEASQSSYCSTTVSYCSSSASLVVLTRSTNERPADIHSWTY